MAKASDIITAVRSALSETTDRYVQDFDILQAMHGEILDLEQWLSMFAPQWVKFATTEDIAVTAGIFKYAFSSNKEVWGARATFADGREEEVSIGDGSHGYGIERVGEFIYITPTPGENFTLRIYKRDTFVDALPTRYDDDLTNATAPKGVPFFAESFFRNRVLSRVAKSLQPFNSRFAALAQEFADLAESQRPALMLHADRISVNSEFQKLTGGW